MNSLVSYKVAQLTETNLTSIVLTGKRLKLIVDSCMLLEATELREILITLPTFIRAVVLVRPLMLLEYSLAVEDLLASILFANEEHF